MRSIFHIIFLLVLVWSCSEEPVETVYWDLDAGKGIFIACEGNFMYGNGSLSFYHPEMKKVTNQLFYARNNSPLGDVVQSLARMDHSLFIVVNNSGKVVVADDRTVAFRGAITGLTSPRYIHFVSGEKAYISDMYADHITVFNPETFRVTGTIGLNGHTSEQMVQAGRFVFASHWVDGENVLVIDTATDELADKIPVPAQPRDMEVDGNGKIWTLCGGSYQNSGPDGLSSALVRIDPETRTVEQIYRFGEGMPASNLEMNAAGDTLYFIRGDVFKMPVNSRYLPDSAFIPAENKLFYHLAVSPASRELYIADAVDYTQDAVMYRFSGDGIPVDTFKVGINPSGLLFGE